MHKTQIVHAPDWARSELWDAKGFADTPGQSGATGSQGLIRMLLAERVGLVTHTTQSELAVYSLTVGKTGPQQVKSAGDPNGLPKDNDNENGRQRTIQVRNTTMRELCRLLRCFVERPEQITCRLFALSS